MAIIRDLEAGVELPAQASILRCARRKYAVSMRSRVCHETGKGFFADRETVSGLS